MDDVCDLITGGSRLGLLIFMRMGLRARACTVRRDRVRAGIPRKGAGLEGTASANAEVFVLVGVVLLRLLTIWRRCPGYGW